MKPLLFLALVTIFFSVSCKKTEERPTSGPTSANGQVVQKHSGKAVPYAQVRLVSQKKGATAMSNSTDKTVWADENGNYSISFEADADHLYKLSASAAHYFTDNLGTYIDPGIENKNVQLDIEAKGYIKFNVINEGVRDTIEYSIYGNFTTVELYGVSRDTIVCRETTGNKEQGIRIEKWTRTGNTHEIDKFFLPALDTLEYIIKY